MTMSSERQTPSFANNLSPGSIIQFNIVIKKYHNCAPYACKQKFEKSWYFTSRERDLKSDITSLDLRYKFGTYCGIFLSEISWLETEIHKNVQEGTNTMSVFIKCNGSELGCAGKYIQLVFAGLNKISMFLAYTSQTFSINKKIERVGPNKVMSSV